MVTKSTRSARRLLLLAVAMFGFAFALVPLYDVFCEVTGINGKTDNEAAASSAGIDQDRLVTIEFIAYINPGMRWTFEPQVNQMKVHPGETHTINYLATNNARYDTIGQAVPSVSPGLAAQYLNKIECFCFNRQPLPRGEDASLPLIFYVDPELPDDINHLTLAYTLFDVTASAKE
ncbi:cytochrome c oxidase assembly protein [Salinivibrio siamensis]|uniref:Cytochrome c oxidase assembly protein CtaG n=1 Tax=Salinivibrio siamensis TaxID=414286 RepID=A0ABX3KEZ0_9GAMM|nr:MULTISPECIES: cytochrome c oxidase assembly protein [Salinivibrio]OOE74317.1 cytochrome c oxidase assembly protein [Salinivibrio sp. ML290]OOE87363.1 cytochrome c oxidase assembly protein [Salinivibrio siamensis]